MKNIILAVDRAEKELVDACKKIEKEKNTQLEGILLVSEKFKASTNYSGNESGGYFREVVFDFSEEKNLNDFLNSIKDRVLALHCRMESAIADFAQIVPFFPYNFAPSETSLKWATDKKSMRERLAEYDSTIVPRFTCINAANLPNLAEITAGFAYPVFVKPRSLHSSILANKCESFEELVSVLNTAFNYIDELYRKDGSYQKREMMIEEFMNGTMYSIDAYVDQNGEVYCLPLMRVQLPGEFGIEGYYSYGERLPANENEEERRKAAECSTKAVKALKLLSSSAHIELFKTDRGWKIIELGPRIGGFRHNMYSAAYGIDHYYNDLKIKLGEKPLIPTKLLSYVAGFVMYAELVGVVDSIKGFEEAQKLESVVWLKQHVQAGDKTMLAINGGLPIFDGIFSNTNMEKLEADVAKARELIKIDIN